jgi:hypothetical protein
MGFLLFVLFPRAPLYNPQLVTKPNVLPHLVHGAAFYPGKIPEKRFTMRGAGEFRFLISTREEAGCFIMISEYTGKAAAIAQFFNFDRRLTRFNGFSPGTHRTRIRQPRYFQRKGRYYYQFTVIISPDAPLGQPVTIRLYPLKSCDSMVITGQTF